MIPVFFKLHGRVVGALLMREMATRFGREGLGFAWLVAEPLVFCLGVIFLWALTKPTFNSEHGIQLAPFVMSGYMCLILIRHLINLLTPAIQANMGLLYHRLVTPMHILIARMVLEIGGATIAFVVLYLALLAIGQVGPPHNILLLYAGWGTVAFSGAGFALIMTGLVMRFEAMDRVVGLISYLMIPVSGAFFMVSWLPHSFQRIVMLVPFVHGTEAIRAAIFGEFVETHYSFIYAIAAGAILHVLGLLLIFSSLDRIDVE